MISREDVIKLINDITSLVLKKEFTAACMQLKEMYDKHLKGHLESEQVTEITRLIELIRELKGYSGKAAALVGINLAEQINRGVANKSLATLLSIGRAVFSNEGDPSGLRIIMYAEFDEPKIVQTLKPIALRSTFS